MLIGHKQKCSLKCCTDCSDTMCVTACAAQGLRSGRCPGIRDAAAAAPAVRGRRCAKQRRPGCRRISQEHRDPGVAGGRLGQVRFSPCAIASSCPFRGLLACNACPRISGSTQSQAVTVCSLMGLFSSFNCLIPAARHTCQWQCALDFAYWPGAAQTHCRDGRGLHMHRRESINLPAAWLSARIAPMSMPGVVQLGCREQLKAALEYIREWNTNSRLCHAAQALLAAILRRHSPQVCSNAP